MTEIKHWDKENITLLNERQIGEGFSIVLCEWIRGNRKEYVTWLNNPDSGWGLGHYFDNPVSAGKDFLDRVNRR